MDIKAKASVWENVQQELEGAIVTFASELGRVLGYKAVEHIDIEKAAQDSPVIERMHQLYEYGIHGRWNLKWESIFPGEEDAVNFVEDLQDFRIVSTNVADGDEERKLWLPLSHYVIDCAMARSVHDDGIRLVFPANERPFVGFSASDLALLSGLDERTVRNLMGKNGALRSVRIAKNAFVAHDEGTAWLASRGFKKTEFIGEEARDLARYPFVNSDDVAKHVSALLKNTSTTETDAPVEVHELLAEAHAGTVQFDLQRATTVARQLGVEPKTFSLALAQFVADQNRRTIEQAFTAAGEKR